MSVLTVFFVSCSAGLGAPQFTNDLVTVTCELAGYADDQGNGWCVESTVAASTNQNPVSGVVLRIDEPKEFTGQLIAFHFDGPPSSDCRRFYEPGLRYCGPVLRADIGRLAFRCDPGLPCTGLAEPLPSNDPGNLRELLRQRHWNSEYVAAIKRQFGEKVLFRTVYGFLTGTNHSDASYADEQRAAKLLIAFQLACEVSLARAISETIGPWDDSIGEWPSHLCHQFGQEQVLKSLDELEKTKRSGAEREKLEVWHLWISLE